MNCEEAKAAFSSHLDGEELRTEEADALEGHLADCISCRAQAKEAAATHRDLLLLRAADVNAKASPVAPGKRQKREAEVGPHSVQQPSFWIEAAAAVVLAAVMAYLLWPTGQPAGQAKEKVAAQEPAVKTDSTIGLVAACQGQVERKADNNATPVVLKPGDELATGHEVHTAQEGYAVLNLTGGPVIRLEAESVLRIGSPGEPTCVLLLRGQGRFDVTKRDLPWRVQTPNAIVETQESVFFISVQE